MKSRSEDFFEFIFAMQIVTSLDVYDIDIPANSEVFITEFRKLIKFEILNPRGIVQLFLPGWSYDQLFGQDADEVVVVNKDQEVSIMDSLEIYLIILCAVLIVLGILWLLKVLIKPYAEKIKATLEGIWRKMFWNNAIKSILVAYLDLCHGATA